MDKEKRNSILTLIIVILIGAGLAFAGSQEGSRFIGIPVFFRAKNSTISLAGLPISL